MPQFTARGVHQPLADKCPALHPRNLDFARFSKENDEGGVAGQRAAHFKRYADDQDIAALAAIPKAAWDPKHPEIGALHGIVWITLRDLHPTLDKAEPFAALTSRGQTLFVSVALSATKAHITRDDGSTENGYTWLLLSLLNQYRKAAQVRFADDLTRAGRTDVGWASIKEKCHDYEIAMTFGGRSYDLTDKGHRTALAILSVVASTDDDLRREKLTGKRIAKFDLGGCGVPEHGMPKGWRHARDAHGRRIKLDDRGYVPEAEPSMTEVLQKLYSRYAAGDGASALYPLIKGFEADGLLVRRDHSRPDNTYAASEGLATSKDAAVWPFFFSASARPETVPTEEAIARYLDGEDPLQLFTEDVNAYLGRVELVRTGRYYRRLRNDMKGIQTKGVNGYRPVMSDELDVKGSFYALSDPWPWPLDEEGQPIPSFGIDDATCRQVGARLLRRLGRTPDGRGGRSRRDGLRRALQTFGTWTTSAEDPANVYEDQPTAWGVRARTHNSGKNTFCVMHRPASETGGWGYLPDVATGSLAELTASLARVLDSAARDLIDPETVVSAAVVPGHAGDGNSALRLRIRRREDDRAQLELEARGFYRMAARASATEDEAAAALHEERAKTTEEDMAALTAEIEALEEQLVQLDESSTERDAEANLGLVAFLVANLERASEQRGLTSGRVGKLCDETFTNWRFAPQAAALSWSCTARVHLTTGEVLELPLTGTIRDLHHSAGVAQHRLAATARYIFDEGRDVDQVAGYVGCERRTLFNYHVMPWLRDNGVTSPGLKCALVDHPVGLVRQIMWRSVKGQDALDLTVAPAFADLIRRTYLNATETWGYTTVPDDVTWVQRALDVLTRDDATAREGISVEELALLLDKSVWTVRQLVTPRSRVNGFKRPRYIEYADDARTRLRPITCPHDQTPAAHVCLTPEVAASGVGVLCRRCRRVPVADANWSRVLFPVEYLARWTRSPAKTSIMDGRGTIEY